MDIQAVTKNNKCVVCNSDKWYSLPDPSPEQSITTSGVFVEEPLGKSQCAACGLLQRTEKKYLALTDFYERKYASYYERLGAEMFNKERYLEIAGWISSAVGNFKPRSIVDVGCGRGWTILEMKKVYPESVVEGIEPSVDNSKIARDQGLSVYTARVGGGHSLNKKYDLVFSVHVLQHTINPIDFFKGLHDLVEEKGVVVAIVQDASLPTSEILYSDQNFSFLPKHLYEVAKCAGLTVLSWHKAPPSDGLLFSQLVVCAKEAKKPIALKLKGDATPELGKAALEYLYHRRCEYLESWPRVNEFLAWKTGKNRRVYNFGAGMFGFLLACYCKNYWERVSMCTVDDFRGNFLDKEVKPFKELNLGEHDCFVLGVRPRAQRALASRFSDLPADIICWDNFLE